MNSIEILSIQIRAEGGGAEKVAVLLSKLVSRDDLRSNVVVVDGPLSNETDHSLPVLSRVSTKKIHGMIQAILNLRKIIKQLKPDIVHLHCERSEVTYALYELIFFDFRRRIVITEHTQNPYPRNKNLGFIVRAVLQLAPVRFVSVFPNASGFLVIPNPLVDLFESSNESKPSSPEDVTLVVVGRLIESKSVDIVLMAASNAGWKNKIEIFGHGPAIENLKTLARELNLKVTFMGYEPRPWAKISKNSLFISASQFEGESLSLIEAMAFGLPCIVSAIDAHLNTPLPEESFFYDQRELEIKLLEAAVNPIRFKPNGERLQTYITARRPEAVAQKWVTLYKDVLLTQKGK